ncbi:ABC transporter ATP-binding protein [Aestuariivirga sp.]|uniref:ABC transporter ATP-binding protein n=1 Tax=Aestuariivirga sp. TaxID=2650926 RepID=UPI0039E299E7
MNMIARDEAAQRVGQGEPQSHGLAIALSDVSKSFGERKVLKHLSLTLTPGEFVAVVGRSGCGKTTLLRLISGLEKPSDGTVTIDGRSPAEQHKKIKLLFQDPRLLPWQTVLGNVGIARGQGWEKAATTMLRLVGLQGREGDWPAVLSGGQRQRVALARALVSTPDVLLLDEPFGALDALTRIEMHELLMSLWSGRRFTAVLITHDVAEAVALADRVIVLKDGEIAFECPIPLPRPRRALGDSAAARLQAEILSHV